MVPRQEQYDSFRSRKNKNSSANNPTFHKSNDHYYTCLGFRRLGYSSHLVSLLTP